MNKVISQTQARIEYQIFINKFLKSLESEKR